MATKYTRLEAMGVHRGEERWQSVVHKQVAHLEDFLQYATMNCVILLLHAFLSKVCHNVGVEPLLQPLFGEQFHYRTANVEDCARLDISVEIFWGQDRRLAY